MIAPGKTLDRANLHVRHGKIEAVGPQVTGSPESVRIDIEGAVVHAGYLDPYVPGEKLGLERDRFENGKPNSGAHPQLHDDLRVSDVLSLEDDALEGYRKLGFVAVAVAPQRGLLRGQAALYTTIDGSSSEALVSPSVYSTLKFEELGWGKLDGENYPLSLMGCVALFRQTFLELDWYLKARATEGFTSEKPAISANLASLVAVQEGSRLLLGESNDFVDGLRLLSLYRELGLKRGAVVLSGEEWRELSWLKQSVRPHDRFIVPLDFPKDPELEDGLGQRDAELDLLRRWYYGPANPKWLHENGLNFSFTTFRLKDLNELSDRLREALAAGLPESAALAALTTEPASLLGVSKEFGTLEPGKSASFVVRDGAPFGEKSAIREIWVAGKRYPDYETIAKGKSSKPEEVSSRDFISPSNYRVRPKLLPEPYVPKSVLFKNTTVWTQSQAGVLDSADVMVRDGRIVSVGKELRGDGAHIVDGTGLHLTPGLVDCHSHTAVQGMVNEPGAAVTSMVRMKDVIDPFDHDIYLQLASGVTSTNILHGSANAIGGQSITCKWRYGSHAEGLIFKAAPEGIKFALGENPKQSNWGDAHQSRYPQTRMGVIELIRGSFVAAHNYRRLKNQGQNPRPDLKLEALLEVLDGKRLVHCHSYRQDEILALLRTAEEVGFKVNVFQHVLEGYKVAKELAEHGAACSTFADWWAYKTEVEDAIPQNASLLHQAGVSVSINSDSDDLARRLNTEAAKSLRYGEMTEAQALDMITRNPAQQLGISAKVGSVEVGMDADLVLWSDHPLKQNSLVLETWIDGARYFQRAQEQSRVDGLQAERERYVSALKGGEE